MTRTRTITPRPIAVREERLFGHGVIGSAAARPIAVREEQLVGQSVIAAPTLGFGREPMDG